MEKRDTPCATASHAGPAAPWRRSHEPRTLMTSSPRRPGWTRPLTAAVAVTALALTVATAAVAGPKAPPVELQLLTVSDWHGQLDPVNITGVGNVGGAAV